MAATAGSKLSPSTANGSASLVRVGSALEIMSIDDLTRLAEVLYKGGGSAIPGIDRWEKLFTIILAGREIGLSSSQSLSCIMLMSGKPTIYGDGALALVRASGFLDYIKEGIEGVLDDRTAACVVKRKGEDERTVTFSMADANRAGLIERAKGKDGKGTGPWVSYPDRMLTMRARSWALRDVFPDVLRGLICYEEAADMEAATVNSPRVVQVEATADHSPVKGRSEASAPAISAPTPALAAGTSPGSNCPFESPAPSAIAAATGEMMVTDDQLREIALLRSNMLTAKGIKNPTDQAATWAGVMEKVGVKSAKQFTSEQAAAFISQFGTEHDPFCHPSSESKA